MLKEPNVICGCPFCNGQCFKIRTGQYFKISTGQHIKNLLTSGFNI